MFSDNGTIQPSDARLKTNPEVIPDAVYRAWGKARRNIKMWRWLHKEATDARLHFGPIAQELFSEFEAENINPFEFGFACSDPVYEVQREFNGDGDLVREIDVPVIDEETGKQMLKYSIRQNELLMLEIAYQVWNESN